MSWWGKLAGGTLGFWMGGPIGAIIGVMFGHQMDQASLRARGIPTAREGIQAAFFTATFSVMGHIAKADGHVTQDEIRIAEAFMTQMRLSPEQRAYAKRLFSEGKKADFDLAAVMEQFRRVCHRRGNLVRVFLEIQMQAAFADGRLDDNEAAVLRDICAYLGIADAEFEHLCAFFRAGPRGGERVDPVAELASSYEILAVSETATDSEVKRAYRRLMNQHHPDKLVSKGLPEEMMAVATQKTHEIRKAYETIREQRAA